MIKVLMYVACIVVMAVGGFMDPERRYIYLFVIFIGLLGTSRAYLAWEKKRVERIGGSL